MSQANRFHIVIPARFASERLPGKPLLEIGGVPMVVAVARRAEAAGGNDVIVATDDQRIVDACEQHGVTAEMTRNDHASGTDRLREVAERRQWPDDAVVVNLQGDEPLMPAACLRQVAACLEGAPAADAATLYLTASTLDADFANPNVVKLVADDAGRALYFSRSPIPTVRDGTEATFRRHVGLYAYRVATLRRFGDTAPTPLERLERLEQLRLLETGGTIVVAEACEPIPPGVDTPVDLERVRKAL